MTKTNRSLALLAAGLLAVAAASPALAQNPADARGCGATS